MCKVLVIYDSKTGMTEKMAKAVVEGIQMVRGVTSELLKLGKPFALTKLEEADAIILGSPTHYANVTREMRSMLESVFSLQKSGKINLSGKVGAVFGSYAWDRGRVIDMLNEDVKAIGIRVVAPAVSAVDRQGELGIRIDEDSLQKCRELGRTVALEFAV